MVNFLLQYTPDAIVDCVQIRLIQGQQCWRNEVGHLSLQESDGDSCSMRQSTVLLKDKTPPWDIRDMSGSIASWQEYYRNSMLHSLDKMDFSAAINKLLFKRYVQI